MASRLNCTLASSLRRIAVLENVAHTLLQVKDVRIIDILVPWQPLLMLLQRAQAVRKLEQVLTVWA